MNRKPNNKRPIQVLIVDDHPALREALVLRISRMTDMAVCGEAADMAGGLRLIAEMKPDVAVVDISLKDGSGIDLIKRINTRNDGTDVRVLVWSMYSEMLYAERALRAGALGYITKDNASDVVIDAIRRVEQGKVFLSDAMAEKLLHRSVGTAADPGRMPLDSLSNREIEVLRLIGERMKTKAIAERLHLSVKTVETYRDRLRQKLNLADSEALSRFAEEWETQIH